MSQSLVIAHHIIWSTYGSWLPNDPRGSGSTTVRNDLLADLGELHRGRKKIQPPYREVRAFQVKAADLLEHAVLLLDEYERTAVAQAFEQVIIRERLTVYACAIMPDHVHAVVRKHKHSAELIGGLWQGASRERLIELGRRAIDHPVWCGGSPWKIFLDHPEEVRRTIRYVERNPEKIGLPRQEWSFIVPYDGWPLYPGHSANSPYVKALRAAGRYP